MSGNLYHELAHGNVPPKSWSPWFNATSAVPTTAAIFAERQSSGRSMKLQRVHFQTAPVALRKRNEARSLKRASQLSQRLSIAPLSTVISRL